MVLDQRFPLENTCKWLSPLSQVLDLLSSHKAQSNRAQSYSLYKLRMKVWSTEPTSGGGDTPSRNLGKPRSTYAGVLQE